MANASHVVGIDLGTTNNGLARLLISDEAARPEPVAIAQVVRPGQIAERPLLPSSLYLPHPSEFPEGALALPWEPNPSQLVGELARTHGAQVPTRLVSSAKSWLSFAGADRRAAILPWQAPEEVARVSPVEASAAYLAHLSAAYRASTGESLADQEVVLTVPASFDAVARELTMEAAAKAGLTPTLLEEPQAALYAWLAGAGERWRSQLKVGDVLLVVDVGGGTTDFSLIVVREQEGNLALERVAVGDHLLLGGDNMDLALAHALRARLAEQNKNLDAWQFQALVHGARAAKEQLFVDGAKASCPVVVPGRGSGLVGGSLRTELLRADVDAMLVDGFLPMVPVTELPQKARRTALTEIHLPYASDAAITRHLAAFLTRHAGALGGGTHSFLHPSAVLFNGGVMKAAPLQRRLVETIASWVKAEGGEAPRLLEAPDLDLAVAKGAAYYGLVRAGRGVRIRGGTARAYYVGIESAAPAVPGVAPEVTAVCVAPFGMEEGSAPARLEQAFGLVLGESAPFRFYASSVRRQDAVGARTAGDDRDLEELPPMEVRLDAPGDEGKVVPVRLEARVTELGTLALEVAERTGERRWKLEFNVRPQA